MAGKTDLFAPPSKDELANSMFAPPNADELKRVGGKDDSVHAGIKKFISDPMAYIEERKNALASAEGLLAERAESGVPAEPISNFGRTGALPLAATGARGMQTVYDSAFRANGVIPSASVGTEATAVAAREPITKAAGLLVKGYQSAKPYLKAGGGLYLAKKLGLLN